MKKALFIYNPNAGKGLLKPKLSDIIDIIVKAGYEVVVYPTQKYKDAYYKVKTFTEEYDRVICSGGDGTLDEVVTGMMKREKKIPVGYIPTGTTNDFASISRRIFSRRQVQLQGGKNFPVISDGLTEMCSCTLQHSDSSRMYLMRQSRK